MPSVLQDAKHLSREGLAIHWLRRKSKAPVENGWSKAPVNTPADLEETYRDGYNVGLRLGKPSKVDGLYCHVLDIDIRDPEAKDAALDALDDLLPGWEKHPQVKSGSGGPSFHVYLFTDKPFASKKLKNSKGKIAWTDRDGKKHNSWKWEIELFGTGKQVAIPPSIHPETGKPYRWLREINFADMDLGLYTVAPATVEAWVGAAGDEDDGSSTPKSDASRSLTNLVQNQPLGLDEDKIWSYLGDLDRGEYETYWPWLRVGMALHHESRGANWGLDLWHDFSEDMSAYDADELDEKWKSFGQGDMRPVRFASIIEAGKGRRLQKEIAGAADDEDFTQDADDETAWVKKLDISDKGQIKATLGNCRTILENDPRTRSLFSFNEFSGKPVIRGKPGFKEVASKKLQPLCSQLEGKCWGLTKRDAMAGKDVEDIHMAEVRECFSRSYRQGGYGVQFSDRDLLAARDIVANKRRFHPIAEYLEKLVWDGVPRVDTLFVDWLGCPDTPYHREAGRLFLLGAIARVYKPGHKFDYAPILEGGQGIRKSTFIRTLARDWFGEFDCDFDDPKRAVEAMAGNWILELPELTQFRKDDVESMKAFITKQYDQVRLSYRRDEQVIYRQSLFMGSTNNSEYLRDATGNRRFWPIKVGVKQIDTEGFRKIVDQVWAEALTLYEAMCEQHPHDRLPLMMSPAADREAQSIQAERVVETNADLLAGLISAWANRKVPASELAGGAAGFSAEDDTLVRREFICVAEVAIECLNKQPGDLMRGESLRIGEAIKKTGEWEPAGAQRHRHYGKPKVFRRIRRRRSDADLGL